MTEESIFTLRDQLKTYENDSSVLEPQIDVLKTWKNQVDEYSFDYLDNVKNQKVYNKHNSKEFLSIEFTEEPKSLDSLIELLRSEYNNSGTQTASPNYMAFIGGGGLYPSSLGDYIAAATNKFSSGYGCPAAIDIENKIISWISKLIGFPSDKSTGNICSGSSTGVLYSIHVARDFKKVRCEIYSKLVTYCTTITHGCLIKALKVAGLADSIVRNVLVDEMYRMIPSELESMIENDLSKGLIPFMVFSNAGSTDLGSIDPLYELGLIANRYGIWYHVDAAYGGFFMLTESRKDMFKGIELADSVTLDPHKTLFLPYGCGVVIYKDSKSAKNAFSVECNCLQDTKNDSISPADVSMELTRHFRGMRIWLPLQLYGLQAFRRCLEEKLLLAKYFYNSVREIGFRVGTEPQLSVVIFRHESVKNEEILEMVKEDGTAFISSTRISGIYWLRCAIVSFRTHLTHVDNCINVLGKCLNKLKAK